MAARFWVGASGNWSDTAHWSTTSGGSGGSAVPTSADDVTLGALSGTAATCTIDAAANANTITINKTDIILLHNAGSTVVGTVTLTSGTLNTNGQTCLWMGLKIYSSPSTSLTLGNSSITYTGTSGGSLRFFGATSPTFTANTAILTFGVYSTGIDFPGNTSINMNGTSLVFSATVGVHYIGSNSGTGTLTFANITLVGGAGKSAGLNIGVPNLICTGTFSIGGNTTQGVNRLLVAVGGSASVAPGTQKTITAAAVVITGDVAFMDINIVYSGAASWTNAGSAWVEDCGGNGAVVLANATPSVPQTATGTASFTWSTHAWSGAGGVNHAPPLAQDDVFIPNAFAAGRTITSDMPRIGRSVTCTCTGSPTLSWSVAPTLYGGLALASGMVLSGSGTITFNGRTGTNSIACNGVALSGPVRINFSNTWTVFDLECTTARTITLPANGTQTVTGNILKTTGATGQLISFVSSTPGTATTIQYNGFAAPVMSKYALSADVVMNSPRVQLPIQVGNLGGIGI